MSTGDYFCVFTQNHAHKHSARHRNPSFPFQSTTHFSFLSLFQVLKFHLGRGERHKGAHQMGTKQHALTWLSLYIIFKLAILWIGSTQTKRLCPWAASALRYLEMGISLHSRAHCVPARTMKTVSLCLSWKRCECEHGRTTHKYALDFQVFLDAQEKKTS